ncbi:hypothetical protein FGO68_gene10142 [Halteria grandinella]|uniref:MORN repeat protein n=1 Tax=Halteria grandinella TaxID=5974 RepID=A0A8J8NNP5_HALGN|nr:hypothetical protein FGO68_gene10142 [Halteria grandinella]
MQQLCLLAFKRKTIPLKFSQQRMFTRQNNTYRDEIKAVIDGEENQPLIQKITSDEVWNEKGPRLIVSKKMPRFTIEIEDKLLASLRQKYGDFNFDEHFDRVEEMLGQSQERQWVQTQGKVFKYQGEAIKGTQIPYGRGMVIDMSEGGLVYQGWFKNGICHGYGREFTKHHQGLIYEGGFHMGHFEDKQGTTVWDFLGHRYEGGYSEGLANGYGYWNQGNRGYYKGNFLKGMKHGYGEDISPDLNVQGMFFKDQIHGYANMKNNYSEFEGEFNMGKFNGFGMIYNYEDDIKVWGRFKDDMHHGSSVQQNPMANMKAFHFRGKLWYIKEIKDFGRFQKKVILRIVYSCTYYTRLIRFLLAYSLKKKNGV